MKKTLVKIFIAFSLVSVMAAGCHKVATNQTQSGAIQYQGVQGRTALDLLKSKYKVETKTFSAGEYVQAINDQAADSSHYWAFYVNGKQATVGASSYVTTNSDSIEWKLEAVNSKL